MTNPARCFAIAALLTLAACGNKGPLVRPSQIPATPSAPVAPADTSPASVDPTGTAPVEEKALPAAATPPSGGGQG